MNIQSLLQQRLSCYRFAYVTVDPALLPSRREWQIPDLRGSFPCDGQMAYRLNLPTPRLRERGPILSTSAERLRHFRKQDSYRPLILMRPAFEAPMPPKRLAGLAKVPPLLQRLLKPGDAYVPLEWRRPLDRLRYPEVAVHAKSLREHPMVQHLQSIKACAGSTPFLLQEDGFLLQQESLLTTPGRHAMKLDRNLLADYDRSWRETFASSGGHVYVISKSKLRLDWFARDSLRNLGPHAYRWSYPSQPDPRNRGRNWILVQDRDMQWDCLERRIPCLFLDDDEAQRNYRRLRLGHGGRVRWRSLGELRLKGILNFGEMRLLCQDQGSGWQLAFTEEAAPDGTPALNHRLDQLATLIA